MLIKLFRSIKVQSSYLDWRADTMANSIEYIKQRVNPPDTLRVPKLQKHVRLMVKESAMKKRKKATKKTYEEVATQ